MILNTATYELIKNQAKSIIDVKAPQSLLVDPSLVMDNSQLHNEVLEKDMLIDQIKAQEKEKKVKNKKQTTKLTKKKQKITQVEKK